jgi:cytochrome c biogenesis protein CcmG/thiol:disulfide interchange protein DsbE
LERDFGIVMDPFGWLRGRALGSSRGYATTSDDRIATARPAPRRARAALLALTLMVVLAACTPDRPAATTRSGDGAPALGAQPLVERSAEQFTADLAKLEGRVVVVNFWASWCVPCRTELPDLQKVSGEFAGQPVTFVGVDASDERGAAAKLLGRTGVTYATVYDRQGIYGGIASRWSVTGLPQTWFVAKDGSRSLRVPRQISAEELRANVKRLLATG